MTDRSVRGRGPMPVGPCTLTSARLATATAGRTTTSYVLPALPFDPAELEPYYHADAVRAHHDRHHRAHVIGANRALDQLSAARRGGDWTAINQLESDFAFHVSGHLLHSVFWTNLSPHPVSRPGGELRMAMDDGFGSFGLFREQFGRAALGVQGSGWAALAWEPLGGHLVIEQLRDNHASSVLGTHLLLVCDVWEHCYDRQHGHDRDAWIDAFWHLVDWADVERRFVGTGVFDEFYVDPLASPSLRRLRPPSAGRADLPHASRTDTHG